MLMVKEELLSIEKGWTVRVEHMPIIAGVTLVIFDNREAVLRINGAEVIEFKWTAESSAMFSDIDTAETIEVFELIQRLHIA